MPTPLPFPCSIPGYHQADRRAVLIKRDPPNCRVAPPCLKTATVTSTGAWGARSCAAEAAAGNAVALPFPRIKPASQSQPPVAVRPRALADGCPSRRLPRSRCPGGGSGPRLFHPPRGCPLARTRLWPHEACHAPMPLLRRFCDPEPFTNLALGPPAAAGQMRSPSPVPGVRGLRHECTSVQRTCRAHASSVRKREACVPGLGTTGPSVSTRRSLGQV